MADYKLWLGIAGAAAAAVAAGLPYRTCVTTYTLSSPKINTPVKIVLLADFHNDRSDKGTIALAKRIRELNPDLILMPGDMAEEHNHQERTFLLLKGLQGIPMYYSTGNHEEFRWDLSPLKERFRQHGVDAGNELPGEGVAVPAGIGAQIAAEAMQQDAAGKMERGGRLDLRQRALHGFFVSDFVQKLFHECRLRSDPVFFAVSQLLPHQVADVGEGLRSGGGHGVELDAQIPLER